MPLVDKEIYQFDRFVLDPVERILSCARTPLSLTPKAFDILICLVRNQGRMVTKDELLEQLWPNQFISEVTLHHRVMAARKAIGDSGRAQHCIKTVHGRGYRFIADVTLAEPSPPTPVRSAVTPASADTAACPPAYPQGPSRPFVARETELVQVQQCLTTALSGSRQVVFITGEAGIGKTAMVDTFMAQMVPAGVMYIRLFVFPR